MVELKKKKKKAPGKQKCIARPEEGLLANWKINVTHSVTHSHIWLSSVLSPAHTKKSAPTTLATKEKNFWAFCGIYGWSKSERKLENLASLISLSSYPFQYWEDNSDEWALIVAYNLLQPSLSEKLQWLPSNGVTLQILSILML